MGLTWTHEKPAKWHEVVMRIAADLFEAYGDNPPHEIVRCGGCKYFLSWGKGIGGSCNMNRGWTFGDYWTVNDFCSRGVRDENKVEYLASAHPEIIRCKKRRKTQTNEILPELRSGYERRAGMSDLISRQAAIDALKDFKQGAFEWKDEQEEDSNIWHRADSAIAAALEIGLRIKKLPSVHPKRGKWADGVFCTECGKEAITEWNETGGERFLSPYCPFCGAEMR